MTIEEISRLSWLDFTIYAERICKMYEEDEKRKAEEEKAKAESMNYNFEALANSFSGYGT